MATKKSTTRKASPKRATTTKAAATEKRFADPLDAALRGLPPDMTVEQHENHVRKAALGY